MRILYKFLVFALVLACSLGAKAQVTTYESEQGIKNDISKSVHIFPNPAVEYVHVKLENVKVENVKVTMHNIIGNEINIETEVIDEHELRIRVKDFDAGYYLLALKDDQSKFRGTYKFLKR